jgi:hypothetical protein
VQNVDWMFIIGVTGRKCDIGQNVLQSSLQQEVAAAPVQAFRPYCIPRVGIYYLYYALIM